MGTTTTNYNLYKPVEGETGWATAVNNSTDVIDSVMNANATLGAAAAVHASSDGSSHLFIDQDVTSGSSPVFSGANITGIVALGVAIADVGGLITATDVEGALQENRTAINLNTTHRTSNGSDHSYLDQDVTSGSSPTLDGANITGVDAVNVDIADAGTIITATTVEGALQENRAAIDLNTTHRTSNGSDHSYIDQDVTSGSSPTLDGANITGVDAANVDIADAGGIITATTVEGALQENRTAINLNTAKETNVPTALSVGTVTATTVSITSDGGVDDVTLPEATTTDAGLLGAAKWDEIVANTAKVTNAAHTGDVTGSGALTVEPAAITGKPAATVAGGDLVLVADIDDSNALKQVTAQSIADLGGGGGGFADPMTTRGDIIVRDATNITNRLAVGTNGQILGSDGTDISWQAVPAPADLNISGQVQGDIIYFNGTNWVRLAPGTSGRFLKTLGAAANPAWDAIPLPSDLNIASQAVGNILYFNGTNWVRLASGTAGQLLQANGAAAPTWVAAPSGGAQMEIFTSSGTFNVPAGVSMVLVTGVAGGGGGEGSGAGGKSSSGGGGEGVIDFPYTVTPSGSVSVTVGAAGAAGGAAGAGGNGTNTVFGNLTLIAGTGGGSTGSGIGGDGGGGGLKTTNGRNGVQPSSPSNCFAGGNGAGATVTQTASGGSSVLGFGGWSGKPTSNKNAYGYGGGGGGGNAGIGSDPGGTAGPGIVIVKW